MDFSDQALASEIRGGSEAAFERLMRRYERLVYRIAYGFLGDREGAMEVVQETFLKVYSRLDRWRGEGDLKAWIARIAANEAMDRSRALRRHPTRELDEEMSGRSEPPQEAALREREAHGALRRSLESLSPRNRLAVVLRYFEEMPTRDIAAALECSEGTARNILFRSLQKLRSVLTECEEVLR